MIAALKHYRRAGLVLIAVFIFNSIAPAAEPGRQLFEAYRKIIVLDPGHGGDEIGARGPEGTLEKTVTLNLARVLAAELQRRYRVVLTRTDDSQMSLIERTATANTLNAHAFISIHTGGSLANSTSGSIVYYYQPFAKEARSQTSEFPAKSNNTTAPILWNQVQNRYMEKSRVFAELINARLKTLSATLENRVVGAPLAVLEGADMPAILIEIGYVTNPAEEKKLRDQQYLMDLALAIEKGIDEYFEQKQ